MIHFDLPKEKSSIIKVIGVGGGGGNAVNHMFSQDIEGVNFIICNTDAQALANSGIPNRVQLGPHLTQGLGAGANPEIGRQATEESLDELKGILEVNTKMAFITAGMGGGTGTGGAPIIAKICKDLGILTVGIVTTPFAYEGKKRQLQAEEGIKTLKGYVDTLLVISNDKLRHQFGNLKMREAFERADNVLATAAKCITDVINSTGQINVDFADVCTVMRNGGVAILGSASVSGEDRAHRAIEEALNSPLLNDNDIRGAKWILININSAEGEHEFTMDEVEIIQNHLVGQAGEGTDVIMGLGYDNALGDKLGITLIATGFQHKDPFSKPMPKKPEAKKEEKIVMVLNQQEQATKVVPTKSIENKLHAVPAKTDMLAPKLVDESHVMETPMPHMQDMIEREFIKDEEPVLHFELSGEAVVKPKDEKILGENTLFADSNNTVSKMLLVEKKEELHSGYQPRTSSSNSNSEDSNSESLSPFISKNDQALSAKNSNTPLPAASGGYLARPSNIYAESKAEVSTSMPSVEEPVPPSNVAAKEEEELLDLQMQLVERDDIPAAAKPLAHQAQPPLIPEAEDTAMQDEADEQKRRAAERLHKLRNLSFNVNAADPNNEFETVPAYIRRNMELYNSVSHIENFYSSYEVKTDQNNQTQISTINTFLDGKKPD
ncbi:MAG TPA: cell division protein FtsZ [Chitinophagaceae bacterium]|nr:cell division protein FtsZ [Chitinophagaceae bacterium]